MSTYGENSSYWHSKFGRTFLLHFFLAFNNTGSVIFYLKFCFLRTANQNIFFRLVRGWAAKQTEYSLSVYKDKNAKMFFSDTKILAPKFGTHMFAVIALEKSPQSSRTETPPQPNGVPRYITQVSRQKKGPGLSQNRYPWRKRDNNKDAYDDQNVGICFLRTS